MRYLYLIIAVMCSTFQLMAESKSEQILDDMSLTVERLGAYEVSFQILNSGSFAIAGSYHVDRDTYKLLIANQEIYGDSKSRYTIDNDLKEVVMESIDSSVPMVVANPATAFSRLNKSFDSKIIKMDGSERISLQLTPRKANDLLDSILLEVDSKTKLPLSAIYSSGGEVIEVKIVAFEKSTTTLSPLDDITLPEGYDIIDIR